MFRQSMALFVFCLILITVSNFDGTSGCREGWIDCGNGKCISEIWRCDGDDDCGNMKDEENCEKGRPEEKCLSSQFECVSDHLCIPESWHCNGEHDCIDKSDEKNCEKDAECSGFLCNDHHCIPSKWRCDGFKDCPDGSDEELCPKEKLCSADQFTCASGACVAISKLCDGKKDCSDGSDEGMHCSDTCANKTCGQACRNTPIGPECYCKSGYQLGKDNETCKDVNECLDDGFCSQQCINLPGSYKCSCMEGYELKNRNCFAAGPEPLLVFFTVKEIRGMYLRSGRYFPIQRAIRRSVAVDADPDESRIYWAETSNTSAIYSVKIDGTGLKPILNKGLLIPEDIAVDYVGRNLYITDSGLMQVQVCKLDGTMCHVLHSANTEKPRAIVLDVAEGLLYWSDWGAKTAGIYRSGMDGSQRISLVSKNIKWPNGIAVDHTTNRLYWSDAQLHTIEFITLDGTTRKMVLKDIVYHPISLAVFEDNLYWTDWSTYSLVSCNKFTGLKMSLVARENGQHIMGVYVYHPVLYQKIANPCWSHKCSHMCVLAPLGTYKCVCPPGFVLAENEQTCLPVTCANKTCEQACRNTPTGPVCYCNSGYELEKDNETCKDVNECLDDDLCSQQCINLPGSYTCSCMEGYILKNGTCYAEGPQPLIVFSTLKELRGMHLRSGRYFRIQKARTKLSVLDVDYKKSRIYWIEISEISAIYSAKIDGTGFSTVLNKGLSIPEGIAVDYIGRNLYITDSGLVQVLVCKMVGTMCHVLHGENIEKPRAVALDIGEGMLYWSDWGPKTAGIYRSGMDGSQRTSLVSTNIKWPNGIALDHTTKRLYWSDAALQTIEFITLDGSTRKVVSRNLVHRPFSLAVFEDTLYWTDWSTVSLESCNKFTGHKMNQIAKNDNVFIMGVHVYHPVLQKRIENPCWRSTCSHMCVLAPLGGYKCVCPPGFVLAENGETCILDDNYPQMFVSEGSHIFHLYPEFVGNRAITEISLSGVGNIGGITYDSKSKQLFVSDLDHQKIYAVNMLSSQKIDLVTEGVIDPKDVAYDWSGDNLYWVDSIKNTVEVLSLVTRHRAIVIANLQRPVAITLSPREELMFVATTQETHPVSQYDMDGRNRVVLMKIKGHPMSLALHPSNSELYWVDIPAGIIASLDYKKQNGDIVQRNVSGATSVATSPKFIYWTSAKKHEVYMMRSPEIVQTLALPGSGEDTQLKRVIYASSVTKEPSKCINNGGCSHVCLINPSGRSCFCPEGFMLQNDSMTCVEKRECTKTEFKCVGSQRCISHQLYCDGTVDCEDGSDELCNESMQRCPSTDFQCRNGRCIIPSWECDHRNDCGDNSDEENCPKKSDCDANKFTCDNGECIPELWRCDLHPDCPDQSDERLCNETVCEAMQLRCDYGQCIPSSWGCDGMDDCYGGTDERNCSQEITCDSDLFKCNNGLCLNKQMVCDRRDDCGDGSDEKDCSILEPEPCREGLFRCKDGMCIYNHEICDGHIDCKEHEDEANCSSQCDGDKFACSSNNRCISHRWVCDGEDDCEDGSDENVNECMSNLRATTPPQRNEV